MPKRIGALRSYAGDIRDRLESKSAPMPKTMAPYAKAFIAVQAPFEHAAVVADDAETATHEALALVGKADDDLDAGVDDYADEVSGAKLGPRQNPFKPFSRYSPSVLEELPYSDEPTEVRALVAAVAKKSPPKAVVAGGATCLARCTAVEKRLKAYGTCSVAQVKALAARDLLKPGMQKAIKTLKTHAGSVLADDPAALEALFAPTTTLQAPKARRPKKPARGKASGEPPK